MKQIQPITISNIKPNDVDHAAPAFKYVEPACLFVDDTYQRSLNERSIRLIRKIVSNWSWMAYKPPICAQVGDELHVIDGQHTAIAAATHGGVGKIPVVILPSGTLEERADSFVRHNRDRLNMTATQLYYAKLAAKDEDALTIQQVCERAGVSILRFPPHNYGDGNRNLKVGETLAIKTIEGLVKRRYAKGAREVLEIIVQAKVNPLTGKVVRAIEELLFSEEYKNEITKEQIITLLSERFAHLEDEGDLLALKFRIQQNRGLAIAIFKNKKKVR